MKWPLTLVALIALCVPVLAIAPTPAHAQRAETNQADRQAASNPEDATLGNACGILVATGGADVPGCGLAFESPCLTINFGIARAVEESVTCVFVQAGIYNEVVNLASGIHIDGGYNMRWQRDSYTFPAHAVRVIGGVDSISSHYMTLRAVQLTQPTRVSNLIVQGPNAPAGSGLSTYAVYANNSQRLILEDLQIEAGNGGSGANGVSGSELPPSAPNGVFGGDGFDVGPCNATARGSGGGGGVHVCGGVATSGGMGGQGGTADTSCPFGPTPTSGLPGQNGTGSNPGTGGGSGGVCGPGGQGVPGGAGTNGIGGIAGFSGQVVAGFWQTNPGSGGTSGSPGSGGGGGGGGGGCDAGGNFAGPGGGGGGAGGCGGPLGSPGGGGGGTFGIFNFASTLQTHNIHIIRGIGGNGGAGGQGARGQLGGIGGQGGSPGGGGGQGGQGGNGGNGGHGGGGGGGAGGPSYAVLCVAGQVTNTVAITFTGGGPGAGGPGGLSGVGGHLPAGNPGEDGIAGFLGGVHSCSAASPIAIDPCDIADCTGEPTPCLGDLNNDGVVDVSDLLILLSNWGICID